MTESICIAHGGDISGWSGGTNRVIAFAKTLSDSGFKVHLVVPKPKREIPKELRDVDIHTVPVYAGSVMNQPLRGLLVSLKAKKVAKENNAKLQFEHSSLGGFATLIGCSGFILDMHDLAFSNQVYLSLPLSRLVRKFIYKMEKNAVTQASKIVVVSNPMKEFIMKEWQISDDKIEVLPNGYFEEKFKNFDFSDIGEVDGMISFLGTLEPKLDLNKIVKLAKSLKDSKIYIIGDGPIRGELERRINENCIENVVLTGRLPDEEAFSLLAKSQVTIYPLKESIYTKVLTSVKLFDYAAMGKAMVLDDVSESEIWEEFKRQRAAIFSDPSNPDEFVENVKRLLEDENLRRKLGDNARNLVKDFTWKKQGEKLAKLYKGG